MLRSEYVKGYDVILSILTSIFAVLESIYIHIIDGNSHKNIMNFHILLIFFYLFFFSSWPSLYQLTPLAVTVYANNCINAKKLWEAYRNLKKEHPHIIKSVCRSKCSHTPTHKSDLMFIYVFLYILVCT